MKTPSFKHSILAAAGSLTIVLLAGGVASAHIDPDPIAMQAGTTGTAAFKVEHGCDGSPTTSMKFQLPDGVTGVAAVDKDGWTATVSRDTLEFAGGPLAPDEEDHFDITFTAPTTPGDIRFPVIQTCEKGELAWIEVAEAGQDEPEHPAPTIKITADPPTVEELTPAPEDAGSDATVVATGTEAVLTATVPASSGDDSSNTGTIVVVMVVAAVVLVGGGVVLARRKSTTPTS
jgi:periplasmic copper chaperone A